MQKFMWGFIVSFILVLTLNGCGRQTPMQKLQSSESYDDINRVFWGKEHDGNTPLWHQAVNYCKSHGEKPNCASVMDVYIISNGVKKKIPAYGTSGETLTIPDFK